MKLGCHCSHERKLRIMKSGAGWILAGALLALVPKCPLCLAVWFGLLFGIKLSAPSATSLYITVTTLCSIALIIFVIRQIRLAFHHSSPQHHAPPCPHRISSF